MTPEEALKIAADPLGNPPHAVIQAARVLADALRESQAQTVQMREDAALVADLEAAESDRLTVDGPDERFGWANIARGERLIAKAIRALPAPAARTYDDGVRACIAHVERERERYKSLQFVDGESTCIETGLGLERLLSPAPAVAPVAAPFVPPPMTPITTPTWETAVQRAYKPGPEVVAVSTFTKPFDAEAALVAMRDHLFVKNAAVFPTPEADHVLFYALEVGLAAGRGAK